MNKKLISLLNQLPHALDGTITQTQSINTSFQMPSFHPATKIFGEEYAFDRLNNQIIIYLKKQGYETPQEVIEQPKTSGPDLVIDTKGLYDLNKSGDYKSFVDKLYQSLSQYTNNTAYEGLTIQQQGIFINLYFEGDAQYLKDTLQQTQKPDFGTVYYPSYTGKKLMMEYSAPNMAKSMSIGHFRNTIIGQIMYNILQQTGCEHFSWNYIGDRGTAFGKFIVSLQYAYQQDPRIIDLILTNPESMMGVVYGSFKSIEVDQKEEKARKIVELLEADNQIIVQLRTEIRKLSLMDFETVYEALNIHFDCNLGESFAVKLNNDVASDLKAKDFLHESQGALIVKLKRTPEGQRKPLTSLELDTWEEGRDQVLISAKSDGSTLYAPRDLSLLKWRASTLQADNMIYVVGSEQSVYFEHIITLGKALGYIQNNQMMHLGYGLYLQNGKKMASRSGGAYRAMELIDEITQAILNQFEDRLDHDTAQKLAVSALIINDTKGDISKDVNLDIPSMTKLNGDTGIYIQYTAVRLRSLLEKVSNSLDKNESFAFDAANLSINEKQLLFQTSLLPLKIRTSLDLFKPHVITQYLLELAGLFNKWYNDSDKVLEMNNNQKNTIHYLLLTYLVVMEKCMELLHMPRVEKM